MPAKRPKARVTLTHPSGKFDVTVTVGRAATLRDRGYTSAGAPEAAEASEYASLTVPQLQAELTRRQLDATGKKAELVARLDADDAEDD